MGNHLLFFMQTLLIAFGFLFIQLTFIYLSSRFGLFLWLGKRLFAFIRRRRD